MSTTLLIVCGQAGSGKTTLCRKIASQFKVPYFDYDTLVQSFLHAIEVRQGAGNSRLDFYKEWRKPSYATAWAPVVENLGLGISCIMSAPLTSEIRDPDFFTTLRNESCNPDLNIVSVYLCPNEDLHLENLQKRASERDDEIVADYRQYSQTHERKAPVWNADHSFFLQFSSFGQLDTMIENTVLPVLGFQGAKHV